MKKALFLDRDGVVNHDTGYAHRPEEITFVDGIFELCRRARRKDFEIIIITNQAGIGRGYYTEAQFHALMKWMGERFAREGAPITAYYFCPHHPEHGIGEYLCACECRKPAPGMLHAARARHNLDMRASVLIGDNETDLAAGRAAGVGRLYRVRNHSLSEILSSSEWSV